MTQIPVYVELSPAVRQVYNDLRRNFITELSTGEKLSAPLVLTRWLRLQQVASGFFPDTQDWTDEPCPACGGQVNAASDDTCGVCCGYGKAFKTIPGKWLVEPEDNPRVVGARDMLDKIDGKSIIWCRFRKDVDALLRVLPREQVVEYHGGVGEEARYAAKAAFQDAHSKVRYVLGNARAGGRGVSFSAAIATMYYSHDFGLRVRLQSQDRMVAGGDPRPKGIYDVIAEDTIDQKIVAALIAKKKISDLITGDEPEAWFK